TESKAKLLPSGTGSAIAPSSWNVRFSRLFWSTPLFLMTRVPRSRRRQSNARLDPRCHRRDYFRYFFVVRSSFYLTSEQASDIRQPLSRLQVQTSITEGIAMRHLQRHATRHAKEKIE